MCLPETKSPNKGLMLPSVEQNGGSGIYVREWNILSPSHPF
jgi:hypothetical protein